MKPVSTKTQHYRDSFSKAITIGNNQYWVFRKENFKRALIDKSLKEKQQYPIHPQYQRQESSINQIEGKNQDIKTKTNSNINCQRNSPTASSTKEYINQQIN